MAKKRNDDVGRAVLVALQVTAAFLACLDALCAAAVAQGTMGWKPW